MNDKFTKPGGILDLIKGTNDHRILKNKLDILEKGPATHKYKSRKRVGNRWVYEYDDKGDNNPTQKHRWSMALKQLAGSLAYDKELKPLLDGPIKQSDILTVFDDKHQAVMGIGKGLPNAYGRVSAPYRGSLHLDIGSKGGMFRVMDGGQVHAEGKFAASGNIQPIHRNIKESILSMFDEYKKETEKSVDDTPDLEKGGEGSRGGKVIGHTGSGKPIYARHDSYSGGINANKRKQVKQSHSHYDQTDHRQAASHHYQEHLKAKHAHGRMQAVNERLHGKPSSLLSGGIHPDAHPDVKAKMREHVEAMQHHKEAADAHWGAGGGAGSKSNYHDRVGKHTGLSQSEKDKAEIAANKIMNDAHAKKSVDDNPDLVKEEIVAQDQTFGIQYRPSITSMYGESK